MTSNDSDISAIYCGNKLHSSSRKSGLKRELVSDRGIKCLCFINKQSRPQRAVTHNANSLKKTLESNEGHRHSYLKKNKLVVSCFVFVVVLSSSHDSF